MFRLVIFSSVCLALSGLISCERSDDLNKDFVELSIDSLKILQSDIPSDRYTDLTFVDETTGYAISNSGLIIKTTNGGLNWQILNSPVSFYLEEIQFTDFQTGYITGGDASGGYLLKTSDSGQSWGVYDLKTPDKKIPHGMYFLDNRNGFIAGDKLFIRTSDGGLTWSDVIEDSAWNFYDVKFKNSSVGYAASDNGIYLKTVDGGKNWQSVQTETSEPLKEIFFAGRKSLAECRNKVFVDLETGKECFTVPEGTFDFLFIDETRSVGTGQYYEGGVLPYGYVYLTNDSWATYLLKKYSPQSEALVVTAIARTEKRRIIMIGFGAINTTVIELRF